MSRQRVVEMGKSQQVSQFFDWLQRSPKVQSLCVNLDCDVNEVAEATGGYE